jgi:hypothetical protein
MKFFNLEARLSAYPDEPSNCYSSILDELLFCLTKLKGHAEIAGCVQALREQQWEAWDMGIRILGAVPQHLNAREALRLEGQWRLYAYR